MKYFVFVFVTLISINVFAQGKKIAYLQTEQPAPFSGFLLSPAAFAEIKVAASTQEALFEARLEYELGKQKAESNHQIAVLKADNRFLKRKNSLTLGEVRFWMKRARPTLWEKIDAPLIGILAFAIFTWGHAISVPHWKQ